MAEDPRSRRLERLEALSACGSNTEMGRLLRFFWQPVGVSAELAPGKARFVKILGEELTLYRGESGRAYLVGGRCAHRRTLLHTGWVESEEIRCIYHGWKYNGSGRCTERPAETPKPRDTGIAGYPVHEYCGLIFAYMGESPAPEFSLPRKDVFERPNGLVFARQETWPCNWFQQVENSLDAVHVSFVHQAGIVGNFGRAVTARVPELEYAETTAGIRQTATRGRNNVRVSDWTFPNANHIVVPGVVDGDPWIDVGHWVVPNDDEHSTRFMCYSIPSTSPEVDARIKAYFAEFGDYNPADHHDELFSGKYPEDVLLQLTSAQDYVAAMGQGTIADRDAEQLGKSDMGIALLRRIFWREMDALSSGGPTKDWRRLDHSSELPRQEPEPAGA